MPALPPYIIDPIWEQFGALLPERDVHYPHGQKGKHPPDTWPTPAA